MILDANHPIEKAIQKIEKILIDNHLELIVENGLKIVSTSSNGNTQIFSIVDSEEGNQSISLPRMFDSERIKI